MEPPSAPLSSINSNSRPRIGMSRLANLVAINRNRDAIYLFLSKAQEVELTGEQIDAMRKGNGPLVDPRSLEGLNNSDIKDGLELLSRAVAAMKGRKLEDVQVELATDFAGVFLGIRHEVVPHPSESAYSNSGRLVYQKERDEVMAMYREAGLDKVSDFTEPEDHVALELGFMARLARETASALEANRINEARRYLELQKRFLNKHLMKWVPRLCADVLKAAASEFYQGVALVTRGYVSEDASTVEDLSEQVEQIHAP